MRVYDRYLLRLIWALVGLTGSLIALFVVGVALPVHEQHTPILRSAQIILFGAGLGLIAYALGIARGVRRALDDMKRWVSHQRAGDRSAQVSPPSSVIFPDLVEDLSAIASQLDKKPVNDTHTETERLTQKTRSLQLLYEVAASVNVARDLDDLLTRSLQALKEMVGAHSASMRLIEDDGSTRLIASLGTDQDVVELKQKYAARPYTIDTGEGGALTEVTFFNQLGMISVPLPYRGRTHGVIDLFTETMATEREEVKELLSSIGRHLGMAIERHGLDGEREQLSRMEERTRLAHELHDSLAQSLASLRFQVRVLDETMQDGDEPAMWRELELVENSLDEAYAELRALIEQFRKPVPDTGLVPSIDEIVQRFRDETKTTIFLQNEWRDAQLPAEIEVQVVRIVQEALHNARKHSRAQTMRVMLRSERSGEYRVLIEDDGVGFAQEKVNQRPGNHIGLHIMQERAERIGGVLKVESEPGEGTRVLLTFQYPNTARAGEPAPSLNRAV